MREISKWTVRVAAAAVAALATATSAAVGSQARDDAQRGERGAPTFARDVAPVLYQHCVSCHRPGEIGPMSLRTYEEVRPWATAVRRKVEMREMPPYFADVTQSVELKNVRRLSEAQVATIADWVRAGAPKGSDADLPPLPTFAEGWNHPSGRPPDHVLEMPSAVEIPAEGVMDWQYLYSQAPFPKDQFIEAAELRAGNAAVTHHLSAWLTKVPADVRIGSDGRVTDESGRSVNKRVGGRGAGPGGVERAIASSKGWLALYLPGNSFEQLPPGVGKRLPAGMDVYWDAHYTPRGNATTDRSRIGFWFARAPVTHELLKIYVGDALPTDRKPQKRYWVNGDTIADWREDGKTIPPIPPGASTFVVKSETHINEPITLHSFMPHMHYRGKDMRLSVRWPDGREESVLFVPNYDFNWQLSYEPAQPLRLPAGSTLTCLAHYDNSAAKRGNPAPDQPVAWGEQSWEEMFHCNLMFTIDRLAIDGTASPK